MSAYICERCERPHLPDYACCDLPSEQSRAYRADPLAGSLQQEPRIWFCDACQVFASEGRDMANPDDPRYEHLCSSCAYAIGADAEKSGNHNIAAQEEVVSALYDFARRLGHNHNSTYPQIGSTLTRIVKAFGFNVASIQ